MRSSMSGSGGGVDTMSCHSSGYDDSGSSSSPSRPSAPRDSGSSPYPSYTPPAYDYEREEAERRQKQEELERQRKEEEEKARQRQEEFIRNRDKAVESLKGSGSGAFGIKGSPSGDLQIKALAPDREKRNISTAWKQLYCASTIAVGAIDAASKDPPDIEEVRYLGEEVVKALNGDRMGVACPEKIPDPPEPYGRERLENGASLKFYSSLMQSTAKQARQIIELNRQIIDLKSQLKEKTAAFKQMHQPIEASVVDLRDAKSDVVDLTVVSGDMPFKVKGDKAGTDRIFVTLPQIPVNPERPVWLQLAPRFRYFMDMEDLRDHDIKEYTIIEDLRRNLVLKALHAQSGIVQLPLSAQQRLDAWFEQEVNKARDRIIKEEDQAIQSLQEQSFDKMLREVERYQKKKKARDLKSQEAAKEVSKNIQELLQQEESTIQEARGRSLQDMMKEIQKMKEQGLFKDGDNLLEKSMTDAKFRKALNRSRDNILKKEEETIKTLKRHTQEGMIKEVENLAEQGFDDLVADYIENEKLNAARDIILKQEERAIQAARGRSVEKLTKEIHNLRQQKEQKIKQDQAALSEAERQIDLRQIEKQQATAKLSQYRGFAQKVAADPAQAESMLKEIK